MNASRPALRTWIVISASWFCMSWMCPVAVGHPGVDDRVHELTHAIEVNPNDGRLYLSRAMLHIESDAYERAQRDVDVARRLAPDLVDLDLADGLCSVELRQWARAEGALSRFLRAQPRHVKARTLRARAHRALGKHSEAAADMQVAYEVEPRHDFATTLARDHVAAGSVDRAVAILEDAHTRFGANVVVADLGIELERDRGNWDAALVWFARLPAKLRSAPHGHKRRGDLLARAARNEEARTAYAEALAALRRLPDSRRNSPAMKALENELGALGVEK